MTDRRVSREHIEALLAVDPQRVVSREHLESLVSVQPSLLVSRVHLEALIDYKTNPSYWDGTTRQPIKSKRYWDGTTSKGLKGDSSTAKSAAAYIQAVLADSPWALWTDLSKNAAGFVSDSSGNGNNFTYGEPIPRRSPASPFATQGASSGTSHIATHALVTALNGQSVTWSWWANFPDTSGSGCMLSIGSGGDGWGVGIGSGTWSSAGNKLIFLIGGVQWRDTGVVVPAGRHHFMASRGPSDTYTIYMDGVQVWSLPINSNAPSYGISIGGMGGGSLLHSKIVMNNIAIYPTVLGSARAAAHFNSGAGSQTAMLADSPYSYLTLEGDGNSLLDVSPNKRSAGLGGTLPSSVSGLLNLPGVSWPSGSAGYGRTVYDLQSATFTYETWFRYSALPASNTMLLTQGGTSGITSGVEFETDGKLKFVLYDGQSQMLMTPSALTPNVWNHIVCSIGPSAAKIRLNKNTVASNSMLTNGIAPNGDMFQIRAYSTPGSTGTGAFDLVTPAIFRSQLSDAQTDKHYDAVA